MKRNDPPKPSKTKDEGAGIGVALIANSNGFKLHLVSILRTDPFLGSGRTPQAEVRS
jgi:hypothetical protein